MAGDPVLKSFAVLLRSFLSAATVVLLAGGLFGRGSHAGGATLALMGLALGALAGLGSGGVLGRFLRQQADNHLVFLLCLMALPLAVLPAHSQVFGRQAFAVHDWSSVFLGVAAAAPLGFFTGLSWRIWPIQGARVWTRILLGVGLGGFVALSSVLIFSIFKGSFLVVVVSAPLLWPSLPRQGDRVLLAQMLLTMTVVVSSMFLLFA